MMYTVFCQETKQQKYHTSIIPYSNVRTVIIHIHTKKPLSSHSPSCFPWQNIQSKYKTYFFLPSQ